MVKVNLAAPAKRTCLVLVVHIKAQLLDHVLAQHDVTHLGCLVQQAPAIVISHILQQICVGPVALILAGLFEGLQVALLACSH